MAGMLDRQTEFFWKKKTMVSFYLSILVFLLHIDSFDLYKYGNDVGSNIIKSFSFFVTESFGPVAVPMFFLLSGALFFRNYTNKLYFKKLKSRFKTLVIPYLFWNSLPLISLFFAFLVSKDYNGTLGSTNWFLAIFHHECNVTFWFIFDLIIFIIIAPLINVFLNNKSIAIVTLFLLILLREFGIEIPENIFFRSDSIIFYFLGCIVGKFYMVFLQNKSIAKSFLGLPSLFLCCVIYLQI